MKERELAAKEWGKLFLLYMIQNGHKDVTLSWADFEQAVRAHKGRLEISFSEEGMHFKASIDQFSQS